MLQHKNTKIRRKEKKFFKTLRNILFPFFQNWDLKV